MLHQLNREQRAEYDAFTVWWTLSRVWCFGLCSLSEVRSMGIRRERQPCWPPPTSCSEAHLKPAFEALKAHCWSSIFCTVITLNVANVSPLSIQFDCVCSSIRGCGMLKEYYKCIRFWAHFLYKAQSCSSCTRSFCRSLSFRVCRGGVCTRYRRVLCLVLSPEKSSAANLNLTVPAKSSNARKPNGGSLTEEVIPKQPIPVKYSQHSRILSAILRHYVLSRNRGMARRYTTQYQKQSFLFIR